MTMYDKEKLEENAEILEEVGHKIWLHEQQNKGNLTINEDRRQDFLKALNFILDVTSGVMDERTIEDVEVSPDSDTCYVELVIDSFQVGADHISRLAEIMAKAESFEVKQYDTGDEDDPFVSITVHMKSFWRASK